MKTRNLAIFVAVAVALALSPAAATAQGKVGFVDLSRALDLTTKGKGITKDLANKRDELELQIKEMELNMLTKKDDLNKKKDALSDEAVKAKMKELNQLGMEYQAAVQSATVDFEKYKVELLKNFIERMEAIAQQVAKEEGYAIIILKVEDFMTQSSVVLYGDKSVDLTDKVIRRLNQGTGQ